MRFHHILLWTTAHQLGTRASSRLSRHVSLHRHDRIEFCLTVPSSVTALTVHVFFFSTRDVSISAMSAQIKLTFRVLQVQSSGVRGSMTPQW